MAPAHPETRNPVAAAFIAVLGLALLPLLIAGCGSALLEPNRVEQDARSANQQAARAFDQGRWDAARTLYQEALRLDRSVEDAEGIAVNLLSLARIEQVAGNTLASHAWLDQILQEGPLPMRSVRQAEAAARKAQLLLASGNAAQADEWAARAESLCTTAPCPARASAINLRALAALRSGDPSSALAHAQRALAASEAAGAERANAQRITGEARLARADAAGSIPALEAALSTDTALGLSERIHRDLMLLGSAAERLGRRDEARRYYARALAVAGSRGDDTARKSAVAALERL